jgi:phage tail tape-measure protein
LLKGVGRIGGKVLRPLGMAMGAFDLLGAFKSGSSLKMGRAAGSLGGGLAGGALGATLGSFLVPGIGTVAGGLIGSLLGDLAGEKAGGSAAQSLSESSQQSTPEQEPSIVNNYTFNVTQLPGEDAESLARRVARMVSRPNTGALYDY